MAKKKKGKPGLPSGSIKIIAKDLTRSFSDYHNKLVIKNNQLIIENGQKQNLCIVGDIINNNTKIAIVSRWQKGVIFILWNREHQKAVRLVKASELNHFAKNGFELIGKIKNADRSNISWVDCLDRFSAVSQGLLPVS
jgi:hypothetical protein